MSNVLRRREDLLSLFRIVVGFLFVCHGAAKLFGVPAGRVVPFGAWPNWYAAIIELVAGTAVMLGIGTRIAAVICSGEMAYAYFASHQPKALWPIENGGELAAVYSWIFLLIAFFGPGTWTIARLWNRQKQTAATG
ncbi:DoxX family protein [Kibdelosporangium phytohabitans]|uniref:DoxX family protein n=1 Tax=Kibdelosporangium phytohabitans TaxID=860235 RepID=A0A0N9HHS6_9PSEU|nr:DoxX family protein [Kibdelosporangium phytohabitans]ALG05537.1 DoxX family protein [Kibdelosporangium phytohabitans]MBE1466507.1 putative oxidoreductase [Kibdelosporangium phytohabitans]